MSFYRAQKELNDHIDVEALDALAKSNDMAKERQLSEMKNLLQEASGIIGGYNSSKIDAVCYRLQQEGFGLAQSKKAFRALVDRFDRFPSYRDIKALLNEFTVRVSTPITDPKTSEDYIKYICIKNMFLSKADEEKLTLYVKWWLKAIFGMTEEDLLRGISLNMFEMPALFDWYDTYFQWDLEKIKITAERKNDYIAKQKETGNKIEPYVINKSKEYLKYQNVTAID